MLAHQNAAWTPVRGAPAVSGPPMEDKLLPMWRRPLAVGCTTTLLGVLGTTSVDALLFCWQQLAALRQAACSVPVCVWLALPAYRYPSSSPIWCGPKHMYYVWTGPSLSRPSVEIHRVRLSTFFFPQHDLRWMMLACSWFMGRTTKNRHTCLALKLLGNRLEL